MLNVMLTGVGGQGTVLAAKVLAQAAQEKGWHVRTAETIGMAQRGGSVFSHLRLGEDVYSPMIARGEADLILAFEPGEAVRMLPYLKEGGQVVVSSRPVMPVTATLSGASYAAEDMISFLQTHVKNLMVVDAEKALQDVGSPKVLNLILLGAALQSGALGLTEDDIKTAILQKIPEKFHELNFRALAWAGQNM